MRLAPRVRCLASTALLISSVLLAACATSTGPRIQSQPSTPVVTYQAAEQAGLKVRWQRYVGLATTQGETVRNLWRINDTLYIFTSQGQLHAVDSNAGTTRWTADLSGSRLEIFRPAEANAGKNLLVIDRAQAYLLDKATGNRVKTGKLPFGAACDPTVVDKNACIGSGTEFFYGVYLDFLGREDWRLRSAHDAFVSTPVVAFGKNVILASRNGFLWSVKGDDGSVLWNRKTGGGNVEAGLATDGQRVYVPALNNKLYAFDDLTGNEVWSTYLEGRLDQAAMPAGPTILCIGSGKGLYALTTDKGEQKWFLPGVKQLIAHSANQAFVADATGQLLAVNLETGAVDKTLPISAVAAYAENQATSTVFAITRDGRLTALEPLAK